MAKSFDHCDRYPSPAPGRAKSQGYGGGPTPLDPMGSSVPGWCADPAQNPGDCPKGDCDRTVLGKSTAGNKKLPGNVGR